MLYYAFPVLAPSIAADTGWSIATVTAAFSAGLVVSALVGIPVGSLAGPLRAPAGHDRRVGAGRARRRRHRQRPRSLPVFFAGWLLAGVAMAGTLYPPAFAALTRWWGPRRVTALTALTLLAGLASTVFAPLTAALLEHLRLAAHLPGARRRARRRHDPGAPASGCADRGRNPTPPTSRPHAEQAPDAIARSRPFLLLTTAMALGTFTAFAVVVNQVPLLLERGLSTQLAAWALGLGGARAGPGPAGLHPAHRRDQRPGRAACSSSRSSRIATALLAAAARPRRAAHRRRHARRRRPRRLTLLQATAISDRWGAAHYGRLNGLLSAPAMLATALAPWAGAALAATLGGYPAVFAVLAGVAAVAALLAVGSVPPPVQRPGKPT